MSWIDYEGEAHKDEPSSQWDHNALKAYFLESCNKQKAFPKWGLKDQSLLSSLRKRYSSEQLKKMIDRFMANSTALNMGMFFMVADELWWKIAKEEEDYSWN